MGGGLERGGRGTVAEHRAHDLPERGPLKAVVGQGFLALGSNPVIAALAAGFARTPGGLDQFPLLKPMENGINGPLARFQNAGRLGVKVLHHLVAVAGTIAEHGEQQGFHVAVEGFLGELHKLDGI